MGTITFTTATSGVGPTRKVKVTSGDTTNAKAWTTGTFSPTAESEAAAAKEAIWNEFLRQLLAL